MRGAAIPLLLAVGLVGCGGSDGPEPAANAGQEMSFETGEFEIPPGDTLTCIYTNLHTTDELNVPSAVADQGEWGHHLVIYYTDIEREPGHHPCDEAEMVSWHQIVGASEVDGMGGELQTGIPKGAAIKVPAGKQIVVQSHHINTSGEMKKANDKVVIKLLRTDEVEQFVNTWLMFDSQFEVPAGGSLKHVSECTLERDLDVLTFAGHMHEWGKHYKLERLDKSGAPVETLYETDWALSYSSHPPLVEYTIEEAYHLPAGTRVRQTCEWDNPEVDSLTFPKEMCVGFMYYFPDAGQLDCKVEYPEPL